MDQDLRALKEECLRLFLSGKQTAARYILSNAQATWKNSDLSSIANVLYGTAPDFVSLGLLCQRQGDSRRAIFCYHLALAADPKCRFAGELLDEMRAWAIAKIWDALICDPTESDLNIEEAFHIWPPMRKLFVTKKDQIEGGEHNALPFFFLTKCRT